MEETRRMEDALVVRMAETLKAIGHPVRLRIIEILEQGERSVTEIQDLLGITQSLTSQHLGHMRVRGVLRARKNGSAVYYSIENPDVVKVLECIRRRAAEDSLITPQRRQ